MSDTPDTTPERQALLQGLARQAAAWWREKIQDPGYLSKFDNGDTSRDGEFGRMLASLAALKSPSPSADKFECFEQLLYEVVFTRLWREPIPAKPYSLVLSVDYGPEDVLREVAQEAGVTGFPWKTTMWVNWDADPAKCYVQVRAGYGAPLQRLSPPHEATPTT